MDETARRHHVSISTVFSLDLCLRPVLLRTGHPGHTYQPLHLCFFFVLLPLPPSCSSRCTMASSSAGNSMPLAAAGSNWSAPNPVRPSSLVGNSAAGPPTLHSSVGHSSFSGLPNLSHPTDGAHASNAEQVSGGSLLLDKPSVVADINVQPLAGPTIFLHRASTAPEFVNCVCAAAKSPIFAEGPPYEEAMAKGMSCVVRLPSTAPR